MVSREENKSWHTQTHTTPGVTRNYRRAVSELTQALKEQLKVWWTEMTVVKTGWMKGLKKVCARHSVISSVETKTHSLQRVQKATRPNWAILEFPQNTNLDIKFTFWPGLLIIHLHRIILLFKQFVSQQKCQKTVKHIHCSFSIKIILVSTTNENQWDHHTSSV